MELNLDKLKKEYSVYQKKYSLPSFKDMNVDFEIERTAERESETLLREIRKAIVDKTLGFMRFIELLLNPANAPLFMLLVIKNLGNEEKKKLENLYKLIGGIELEAVILDLNYDEKKEADFIKKTWKQWQEIKPELNDLGKVLSLSWKESSTSSNKKDYFG